jgi:hypothetical protein
VRTGQFIDNIEDFDLGYFCYSTSVNGTGNVGTFYATVNVQLSVPLVSDLNSDVILNTSG